MKKHYFVSDLHLGVPDRDSSRKRELLFCQWLDQVSADASDIYIIGDLFDFWFEYDCAVPKGFIRVQGKLAQLADTGIRIHMFTGNHDLWMRHYFAEEIGLQMYFSPLQITLNEKQFMIGHGDGLGPGDIKFKWMKKVFQCQLSRWLYRWLHPDIGIRLGAYFSWRSRFAHGIKTETYLGDDREWLVQYALKKQQQQHIDYFVFGHRHLPLDLPVGMARYINTGDWLSYNSYAVWDGQQIRLNYFQPPAG
jgi:UDP-2,3-diacylglucosamine hydrolase